MCCQHFQEASINALPALAMCINALPALAVCINASFPSPNSHGKTEGFERQVRMSFNFSILSHKLVDDHLKYMILAVAGNYQYRRGATPKVRIDWYRYICYAWNIVLLSAVLRPVLAHSIRDLQGRWRCEPFVWKKILSRNISQLKCSSYQKQIIEI